MIISVLVNESNQSKKILKIRVRMDVSTYTCFIQKTLLFLGSSLVLGSGRGLPKDFDPNPELNPNYREYGKMFCFANRGNGNIES